MPPIRVDVFPAPLMIAVVLCVLQTSVIGDDTLDRLEHVAEDIRDDSTDNPTDFNVGDSAQRPLSFSFVPPIDEVERDLIPEFESDLGAPSIKARWRVVLNAAEEGLSEEYDNLELVQELVSDLRRPSSHDIHHYCYRLGNHSLSIDFCFFETPRRAGEFLRTRKVSSYAGFTVLQELGDEAYQHGTSRTLLMCYSNLYVDIRAVPSDLILRSARVIADALDKAVEETVAAPTEESPPPMANPTVEPSG